MTQMVLPQTPSPEVQKGAGTSKTSSDRDSGVGDSSYESVSRAEQKRLDRQQSEQNNASEKPSEGKTKTSEGAPNTTSEVEASVVGLTFAELQALLLPAGEQKGNAATSTATAQGGVLFAGLVEGKPGQVAQAGSSNLATALQLTEALVPANGEKASTLDPASLLTGSRFEAAMEMVSQQNTNTAAGKLAAEAQVPLRSYTTSVDVPVNHAEWGDKLMGKLSWLTAKNLSVAEIHLTPPDMGPMEVRVRVQNDQANITVHSANPVVREQLEQHSHRLRDMLGEQGLDLAQFDVSSNSQNQSGQQGSDDDEGSASGSGSMLSAAEGISEDIQTGNLDLSWNGAVDIFA